MVWDGENEGVSEKGTGDSAEWDDTFLRLVEMVFQMLQIEIVTNGGIVEKPGLFTGMNLLDDAGCLTATNSLKSGKQFLALSRLETQLTQR